MQPRLLLVTLVILVFLGAEAAAAATTIVVADGDVGGLIAAISNANSEMGIYVGTDTVESAVGGLYTLTGFAVARWRRKQFRAETENRPVRAA